MRNLRRGSKVVSFPSRTSISQQDLVEEEWLHKRATEALAEWKHKRELIRAALESGAEVQPGMRQARMERRPRLVIR